MADDKPLVGVLMGSKSDWETMKNTSDTLARFGVAHECRVLSAHRTPGATVEYVGAAEARGIEVLIAAAILFTVLAVAGYSYRGALLASRKAEGFVALVTPLPMIV